MLEKASRGGGGSHAEIQFFALGHSFVGSWMPTTVSPGVNLLQDPCGVCVRIRKGKSLSCCLTSVY